MSFDIKWHEILYYWTWVGVCDDECMGAFGIFATLEYIYINFEHIVI